MANLFLVLLPAILGLLIPQPAAAVNSNYLLSGQTLNTDDRLTFDQFDFVMQDDCNLVLYKGGFQSNTANRGRDCKLNLNNNGQLVIKNGDGDTVWNSGPKSQDGNYAAVLHPEGKVVVYGPEVWSANSPIDAGVWLENTPFAKNAMFSGQILDNDGKLTEKNYEFVMQADCNLVLNNHGYGRPGWQSNTHGNGRFCFLRLDHRGELAIKDDSYNTVWSSGAKSRPGHYVLILQDDGRVVVYGPAIWATKPLDSKVTKHEAIAK